MFQALIPKYNASRVIALAMTLLILLSFSGNVALQSVFGQVPAAILPSNKSNIITSNHTSTSNFAQLPVTVRNSGNTLTIQTTNVIQGSSANLLKAQEAMIKKAVVTDISNAVLIAKGSVTSNILVSVNAKVINQLANNRVSTTQGLDFTKKLVAAELANAINATNYNTAGAHTTTMAQQQQIPKVVVDNQAICSGILSSTSATCDFTITIHR
jgi:hypothetical protein